MAGHIEECLTCLAFPEPQRRCIRTTNSLARFNQELKRRTRVVRILPYREACLRLMTTSADLTHCTAWDASDITQMDYSRMPGGYFWARLRNFCWQACKRLSAFSS